MRIHTGGWGVTIAALLLAAGRGAAAQDDSSTPCDSTIRKLSPSYVHNDAGKALGARLTLERGTQTPNVSAGAYPTLRSACASFRGLVTTKAATNPDGLAARLSAGYLIAMRDVTPVPPDASRPDYVPPPKVSSDFGYLNLSAVVTAQSNQQFSESLVSGGGELIYTHDDGPLWRFIPHARVAYGLSANVRSKIRDSLHVSDMFNGLLDGEIEWHATAGPVELLPRFQFFAKQGVNAQVAAAEPTRGWHQSLTVSVPWKISVLRALFVEWDHGPLAVQTDRRHAILLGVITSSN